MVEWDTVSEIFICVVEWDTVNEIFTCGRVGPC